MMRVIEAAFPAWPPYRIDVPPIEHLRWKMETADGQPISPHDVVIAGDEIVATMLAWVGHGKIGSATFVTDRAVDLAVHPNHRGKRFARLIVEPSDARNEEREDYFGFDTQSHAEPVNHMYDDQDGTVVRGIHNWGYDFGLLRRTASLRRSSARRSFLRGLGGRTHRGLVSASRSVSVRVADTLDERTDALWERAHSEFDVIRRRDTRTLDWRYLDPRSGPHILLTATVGLDLVGYLAYREPANGQALLLDVLVDPTCPEAVVALLRGMRGHLRRGDAASLRGWLMPGHPYEPAFEAAGLYRDGSISNVEFATRKLRTSPEAAELIADPSTTMHVTMGDFDWV